jgi:hypothetical protein
VVSGIWKTVTAEIRDKPVQGAQHAAGSTRQRMELISCSIRQMLKKDTIPPAALAAGEAKYRYGIAKKQNPQQPSWLPGTSQE